MKIADFPKSVIDENVDYAVHEITNVIKKYGPRESGSENCYSAEKHIKKELDTFCDETSFEEYKMSPKAFLHYTKIVSALIMLSVVVCGILVFTSVLSMLVAQCIVCGAVALSLFITFMEFVLYKEFMDPLYKKVDAHNLLGVRKPRGEVKKRIVICGHIDAAYEWRHIYYSKKRNLMLPLMYSTVICAVLSLVISIIAIIASLVDMGSFGVFMTEYSYIFHFVTALIMITLFLFADFKTIAPGANDNLTGTYAAVCALRMLDMAGIDFEHTEVCCMINDGEEAGLRGAKAWAKAHYDEYVNSGVETAVLCVDTLTDLEYFRVYNKDMPGTVENDKDFSKLVLESAEDAGYTDLESSNIFMGAADAAAFSQAGITSTCLAGMDPAPALYYHNRRDNADALVPEAIKKGFEIVISTILNFDEK